MRLQKGILDCKWCTYSSIKKHIDTLVRLAIAQERNLQLQAQAAGLLNNNYPIPAADNPEGLRAVFLKEGHVNLQADLPCTLIRQQRVEIARNRFAEKRYKDPMIFRIIPSRTLNPHSWNSNEATQYLFFIRQRVAMKPSFEVGALFKGMETAIRERNIKALCLLTKTHCLAETYGRCANDIPKATLALPTCLFHLASQQ